MGPVLLLRDQNFPVRCLRAPFCSAGLIIMLILKKELEVGFVNGTIRSRSLGVLAQHPTNLGYEM